jgi:hypothetical protein
MLDTLTVIAALVAIIVAYIIAYVYNKCRKC